MIRHRANEYVIGFLFNESMTQVMLINKNRPDWQAGKINALGGKIENNETSREAVAREIYEESTVWTTPQEWTWLGTMSGWDWAVVVYYILRKNLGFFNATDEAIEIFDTDNLPDNLIHNLRWLIPMCVDRERNQHRYGFEGIL